MADYDAVGQAAGMRPGKRFRGSPARLRRLRWRRLTPRSFWILLATALFAALTTLACLASLP